MEKINAFFNPNVGIQDVLSMPDLQRLPTVRDLATGDLQQTSLDKLYTTDNTKTAVERFLCPPVGDGTIVSPEVFSAHLEDLVRKLDRSPNPKVREMLDKEIKPLLVNHQLFMAYYGLMLGG